MLELERKQKHELLKQVDSFQKSEKCFETLKLELEDAQRLLAEKDVKIDNVLAEKTESIERLKTQFSHMADTYESKLEKVNLENRNYLEKVNEMEENHCKSLSEKDELISHLKKDLASIAKGFEERLKKAQTNAEEETAQLYSNFKDLECMYM